MQSLISYILFFFGIVIEGEFVLLSAVIAAHQGLLDIYIVVPIALVGTVASDVFYYTLGKRKASSWLEHSKYQSKLKMVQGKFERNQKKLLLTYRFLYGFRMITPIIIGIEAVPFRRFIMYSIATTVIWCALFVSLGYTIGTFVINKIKQFEHIELYAIGLLALIGLVLALKNYVSREKKY